MSDYGLRICGIGQEAADHHIEIISKFTCLLQRGRPVVLHGDGSPTRRYLYAGDAADAFDTILHKGQLGQIYNIGSADEISNLELCRKILAALKISHSDPSEFRRWVKYTHDRPFNDCRYAIDDSKIRDLGWEQQTSFDEGLKRTVEWYARFGEVWWGDISHVLTPFPMVSEGEVVPDEGHLMHDDPPLPGQECVSESETLTRMASNNGSNSPVDASARNGGRLRG